MSGGGEELYLEGDNNIYMVGHLSRCGRGSFLASQTYNWKEQLAIVSQHERCNSNRQLMLN